MFKPFSSAEPGVSMPLTFPSKTSTSGTVTNNAQNAPQTNGQPATQSTQPVDSKTTVSTTVSASNSAPGSAHAGTASTQSSVATIQSGSIPNPPIVKSNNAASTAQNSTTSNKAAPKMPDATASQNLTTNQSTSTSSNLSASTPQASTAEPIPLAPKKAASPVLQTQQQQSGSPAVKSDPQLNQAVDTAQVNQALGVLEQAAKFFKQRTAVEIKSVPQTQFDSCIAKLQICRSKVEEYLQLQMLSQEELERFEDLQRQLDAVIQLRRQS